MVDVLSPALIGVTLHLLLARPRRTGLLLGVYLVTVAAAYFLGVLLMLGLGVVVLHVDDRAWLWVTNPRPILLGGAMSDLHFRRRPVQGLDTVSAIFDEEDLRGIYILEFSNDEFHVGQAMDVRKRFAQHCSDTSHHAA